MEDRTIIQLAPPGSVRRGVRLNGTYEIEALIAQGGMGEVYKGFNIQTNDPVAIKMILPELSRNPDAFALFRREASTLLNLHHQAIVRYFVFSVDPELQRAYLAMEFVDGPSLTARLRQGPLTLAEAATLRKRIAEGLEAAHRFGVIHRDISPDNIILPGNDPNRAKIIDFGIARSDHGEGTLIGDGFAGKYNYVAPEQLGLAGGVVTNKSDIYSFGLVLAGALLGRPIDMNGTQVEVIEKRRSTPDLSGIDPSVRPLIEAMLQPLPANRPENMAAVATWEGASAGARPAPPKAGRGKEVSGGEVKRRSASSAGLLAAILGAVLVVASVGGTLYVFRDLTPWSGASNHGPTPASGGGAGQSAALTPDQSAGPTPIHKPPPLPDAPVSNNPPSPANTAAESQATQAPAPPHGPPPLPDTPKASDAGSQSAATTGSHKLPPLPDPGPDQTHVASTISTPAPLSTPTPDADAQKPPAQSEPHVPNADEIVDSLNRMKRQKAETGAQATGGNVHSEAPVAPPPKPSASESLPKKSEPAHSSTTAAPAPIPPPPAPIVVAALPPPRASQSVLAMADAMVGVEYVADLPPFSDSGDAKGLALHAEPNPPDGLSFVDLGSGFGQISGKPSKPGQYSFEVVARNEAGAAAHMTARIGVAPAPPAETPAVSVAVPPPPQPLAPPPAPGPVVAAISPADKALSFISGFNGGDCFLTRPVGPSSDSIAIQGIGSDKATFERFYRSFIQEMGSEPVLNVGLINAPQCPVVDLIRARGGDRSRAPKIELAAFDVGRGKPLAGKVVNLAGRRLDLLLVSNEGQVYRLDSRPQPGGDSAVFSIPMTPDAASAEAPQVLLAITSIRPPPALEGFKSAAAADILPRLRNELPGSGMLDVEFFKLVR